MSKKTATAEIAAPLTRNMPYTIQISEEQRSILEAALSELYPTQVAFPQGAPIFEPALLRDMLRDLKHGCRPGQSVHGFSL